MSSKNKQEKQRRHLKVLLHAATCTNADEGRSCPISSHCAKMKRLWQHISNCGDEKCSYKYCRTSRQLLLHHARCTKFSYPSCSPLKQTTTNVPTSVVTTTTSTALCQNVSSSSNRNINARLPSQRMKQAPNFDRYSRRSRSKKSGRMRMQRIPEELKEELNSKTKTIATAQTEMNPVVVVSLQIDRLDLHNETNKKHPNETLSVLSSHVTTLI